MASGVRNTSSYKSATVTADKTQVNTMENISTKFKILDCFSSIFSFSKVVAVAVLFAVVFIPGCSKNAVDEEAQLSNETTDVTTASTSHTVYDRSKAGNMLADSIIFYDSTFSDGVSIKSGEAIEITGETGNYYTVKYGDIIGLVLKKHITLSGETTAKTDSDGGGYIIKNEKVIIERSVIEITGEKNVAPPTKATTKATYSTAYTKTPNSPLGGTFLSEINKARKEKGLSALKTDSALSERAEYYCGMFVKENTTKAIPGYKHLVGKVKNNKGVSKAVSYGNKIFLNEETKSVGISVKENGSGGYYYVILVK